MKGAPNQFEITLHEEEEVPLPPILYMYSLDGKLKMYYSFFEPWKEVDLLHVPKNVA